MSERRTANDREPTSRRPLWKGTVAFGLVSIPVSLRRAVARRRVRFHELHGHDGGRIRRRAVCSLDGAAVSREHIVQGYEVERGRWITVTADELQALSPAASRTIEIAAFVDPQDIDPIYYERTYWLVPDEGASLAYAVLVAALERTHRVAVARFTMRARRHLAVIRPAPHADVGPPALALSTLVFADEIVPLPELEGPSEAPAPGDREITLATRLVASLSGEFRPERYHDEHREQLLAYLMDKAARAAPPPSPPELAPGPPTDLGGALEASVADAERPRKAA